MNKLSYAQQLMALKSLIDTTEKGDVVRELSLWLSLAESVKEARDHNLNCSKDFAANEYQRGLADAAMVVRLTKINNQPTDIGEHFANGISLFTKSDVPASRFLYTFPYTGTFGFPRSYT